MENSTQITNFTLTAYADIGGVKYLYVFIVLLLFLFIFVFNIVLITVICVESSLHEPMYYLLCSLAVNGVYGSIGLFPVVLVNVLSKTHEISQVCCFVQIFILHTYGSCELSNLAVMGYDRYMSICHPLQYRNIMSPIRVCLLISLTWLFAICTFTITLLLTVRMPLCGRIIEKIYCANYSVVKLACGNTTTFNMYASVAIVYTSFPQLLHIVYSYVKLIRVCLKSAKKSQARNTCTSHIITLVIYLFGEFFELIQNRFDMSSVPSVIQIILSIYCLILPL
ncbi:O11H4 protein, partial [Amia calva]|nr:O11H4 protein [Amia calva]